MQPLDSSESLVIDCSVTMAWYFKDEATPYTNAVRAALASEPAAVPALWPPVPVLVGSANDFV